MSVRKLVSKSAPPSRFPLGFKHIAGPLQKLHKPQHNMACSRPPGPPLSSVPPWCLAPSPVGGSPEMRAVHFL